MEQLHATQADYSQKTTERLNWINEELRRQGHAVLTFQNVNPAIREYALIIGTTFNQCTHEPTLSDFYAPSDGQNNCEIAFIIRWMSVTGLVVAYKLA